MRNFLLAAILSVGPGVAQAQSNEPLRQNAYCQNLAVNIGQRAMEGFRVLNTRQSCAATHILESAYRTLDLGRMNCGNQWAQRLMMLESDLLEALDYASETCGQR